jgi:hypothetical protein
MESDELGWRGAGPDPVPSSAERSHSASSTPPGHDRRADELAYAEESATTSPESD